LCYFNVYCRLQITATDYTSRKAWSTRHNAVKLDGQLVTLFYCDELTGSRYYMLSQYLVRLTFPAGGRVNRLVPWHSEERRSLASEVS